ncbi:MAG: 16S rRNA (cytosine(1402)-N(4))-methyltransferase RsmH [Pseudomonadota bacterium]|nr:16S rRNA (cytosine(1402)-N(4))-methyltransferase RsmH [Pseudomonadota bacterium]
MAELQHTPVLEGEVLEALQVSSEGVYVDATFGRGGHARAILSRLGEKGRLLVIDRDPAAVAAAQQMLGGDPRVNVVHAPFSSLTAVLARHDIEGRVTGMIFDFGVSSPQLEDGSRGFSFMVDGPLDMRMDTSRGESAAEWLARVDEGELMSILRRFGEERFARRIARAVAEYRAERRIETTAQLASIIAAAVPTREPGKHPATRSFQAIRIAVNEELREIEQALPQAVEALAAGGRLVVISFHSLEDRIVKRFLRDLAKGDPFPPDLPVPASALRPRLRLVGKPVRAGATEVEYNRRARSAVMRVAEKIARIAGEAA